jgi:hypothetical protein
MDKYVLIYTKYHKNWLLGLKIYSKRHQPTQVLQSKTSPLKPFSSLTQAFLKSYSSLTQVLLKSYSSLSQVLLKSYSSLTQAFLKSYSSLTQVLKTKV